MIWEPSWHLISTEPEKKIPIKTKNKTGDTFSPDISDNDFDLDFDFENSISRPVQVYEYRLIIK